MGFTLKRKLLKRRIATGLNRAYKNNDLQYYECIRNYILYLMES